MSCITGGTVDTGPTADQNLDGEALERGVSRVSVTRAGSLGGADQVQADDATGTHPLARALDHLLDGDLDAMLTALGDVGAGTWLGLLVLVLAVSEIAGRA